MSNLETKFTTFEGQISDNHTDVMAALASIIDSLGGVPTSPTTTLDDIGTLLTNINSNLTNMRAADALFYAATNSLLGQIATNTDTIITNNSLNAQRLLTLLLQTACPCDNTVPMLPPPLLPTVTELEAEAKCQRIQFFLDMYASWVISVVVYLNDNGTISSFQVDNALALTFGSISQDDGLIRPIPTGIRDSLTTLLNTSGSPSAINASIFDEITNGTVIADMRQALYAEDNALDGSPAAKAAALASGGPYASILAAAFYTNWANAIYGDLPEVDASGYDGSICVPEPEETCDTYGAEPYSTDGGITFPNKAIPWGDNGFTTRGTNYSGVSFSNGVLLAESAEGWRFTLVSGSASLGAFIGTGGTGFDVVADDDFSSGPVTIPSPTDLLIVFSSGDFTVEVCRPTTPL